MWYRNPCIAIRVVSPYFPVHSSTYYRLVFKCSSWSVDLIAAVCVQIPEENLFHCRVLYEDSVYAPLRGRQELEENVGIYLADNYEKITVPVPHFGGSDPADIIHDFHRVRANTQCSTQLNLYYKYRF